MRHPQHVVWLMHQHRAVYELFDPSEATPELRDLREKIVAYDTRALSGITRIFANSRRVAERLRQHNGLEATPLYHPPPDAEHLCGGDAWDYVFFPSRLESLKRQDLLIEAARHVATDTKILIGGEGPQRSRYERLIEKHALGDRVRLIGAFSETERIALYAHALAVVFPAFDEDLGYVPLEAMYAAKPVVTCQDSGGPLEFVVAGETGEIVDPSPGALAGADRSSGRAAAPRAGDGRSGPGAHPGDRTVVAARRRHALRVGDRMPGLVRDLWHYRGFVHGSIRREIATQYRGSLLGAAWVLIGPVVMILIYTLVFSHVMRSRLAGVDTAFGYSIFLRRFAALDIFTESLEPAAGGVHRQRQPDEEGDVSAHLPADHRARRGELQFRGHRHAVSALPGRVRQLPGVALLAALPALVVQIALAMGLGMLFATLNVFSATSGRR